MGHDGADTATGAVAASMGSFPDKNPNPVLRIARDGTVVYANRASEPLLRTLDTARGERVPDSITAQLASAAADHAGSRFELTADHSTYAILAVHQPDLDAWNVYGTDITGAKVVEKFPDRNPNPVLRASPDGALIYANTAASVITRTLGTVPGELLPADLLAQIRDRIDGGSSAPIHVTGEGCIYRLDPVLIPEFHFINLYGTDVTATQAMTAFPDENPNPVLRIDRAGILAYANPASAPVMAALGAEVGQAMIRGPAATTASGRRRARAQHRRGGVRAVGSTSCVSSRCRSSSRSTCTAATSLLLARSSGCCSTSCRPRLPSASGTGEAMIADRFEEMAVLFADVVDFTPFSALRPPAEVVGVLNEVFTIFDRLADRYGLEKIKTIGDAYMVAGGITSEGGGVEQVADMALDMVDAMGRVPHGRWQPSADPGRPAGRTRRGRDHRSQEVHLRHLGRHGEHREPPGVPWRPRQDPDHCGDGRPAGVRLRRRAARHCRDQGKGAHRGLLLGRATVVASQDRCR